MKILVIGATGYVGSHVIEAIRARGHDLTVLVRVRADPPVDGAQSETADLSDTRRLTALAGDYDAIVHAVAGQDPSFAAVNHAAVVAMLAGLREDAAFIVPAGSMVFGDTAGQTFDGSEAFAPPPPLAATAATLALVADVSGSGRRAAVFGSFVYGGEGADIPATFVKAARKNGGAVYPGSGTAQWSTVDVRDFADLIVAAAERTPVGGSRWMAAAGEIRISDAAAVLATLLDTGPARALPASDNDYAFGFFAQPLQSDQRFSAASAIAALGWIPRHDSLAGGFRDAIAAAKP